MPIQNDPRHTVAASCGAYISQAIICSFAPLLFVTFRSSFGISLDRLSLMILICFAVQLCSDWITPLLVPRFGYRSLIIAANLFVSAGLVLLSFLPLLIDPYIGILLSVIVYSFGGGMLEVLVSPLAEACPVKNHEATMALLHSFFCWGQVLVIGISTAFFAMFGTAAWRWLALIWAVWPLMVVAYFSRVTIWELPAESGGTASTAAFRTPLFWVFFLMMICAGASEISVSQWASAFAESGLGVSKAVGDLAGPCAFAILMGLGRIGFSLNSNRLSLPRCLMLSGILCIVGYALLALTDSAVVSLIGCGLCGFSVALMWPGTYSLMSARLPAVGTAVFGMMALAGDIGCSAGPALVGFVADLSGSSLKTGFAAAMGFPLLMVAGLLLCRKLCESEKDL